MTLAAFDTFDQNFMLNLVNETLQLMLKCSWPMLMAAIIVGIVVAMFQSVTQVQEQTLSFVPKIVATFLAVAMYGPEICNDIQSFAGRTLSHIGEMGPHKQQGRGPKGRVQPPVVQETPQAPP